MITTPHALVRGTALGGPEGAPLLLLGPSLGTSVTALWSNAVAELGESFRVVGWDLPGHGISPATTTPFTMADLAAGVLALADQLSPDAPVHYAGDSVGGCTGLQLALDAPRRLASLAVLCSGARIGTSGAWLDRAATVRAAGTESMLAGSAERWFSPGFRQREPTTCSTLLTSLADTDAGSYALVCEALAAFDVVDRLPEIEGPVLAVAGEHDAPTPPENLRTIAERVQHGRFVLLDGVAHLAPAEAPGEVARLLIAHAGGALP